jgi:hypothetical protein
VLAWLAARLAHLHPARPPGQGGTPPLSLEVRLDAVAAVLLDGLSYRRAAKMIGISKTVIRQDRRSTTLDYSSGAAVRSNCYAQPRTMSLTGSAVTLVVLPILVFSAPARPCRPRYW